MKILKLKNFMILTTFVIDWLMSCVIIGIITLTFTKMHTR